MRAGTRPGMGIRVVAWTVLAVLPGAVLAHDPPDSAKKPYVVVDVDLHKREFSKHLPFDESFVISGDAWPGLRKLTVRYRPEEEDWLPPPRPSPPPPSCGSDSAPEPTCAEWPPDLSWEPPPRHAAGQTDKATGQEAGNTEKFRIRVPPLKAASDYRFEFCIERQLEGEAKATFEQNAVESLDTYFRKLDKAGLVYKALENKDRKQDRVQKRGETNTDGESQDFDPTNLWRDLTVKSLEGDQIIRREGKVERYDPADDPTGAKKEILLLLQKAQDNRNSVLENLRGETADIEGFDPIGPLEGTRTPEAAEPPEEAEEESPSGLIPRAVAAMEKLLGTPLGIDPVELEILLLSEDFTNRLWQVEMDTNAEFLRNTEGARRFFRRTREDAGDLARGFEPGSVAPDLADVWEAGPELKSRLTHLGETSQELVNAAQLVAAMYRSPDLFGVGDGERAGPGAAAGSDLRENLKALYENLRNANTRLDEVANELRNFRTALLERRQAIQALAQLLDRELADVVAVDGSTDADFETAHGWYVSADVGFAAAPEIDEVIPYMGTNIYLRPVNKRARFKPLECGLCLGRRFSFMVGITLDEIKADQRDGILDNMGLLVGGGLRLNRSIRLSAGTVLFKEKNPNPLIDESSLTGTYFVSLSFDWDVRCAFAGFFSKTANSTCPNKLP